MSFPSPLRVSCAIPALFVLLGRPVPLRPEPPADRVLETLASELDRNFTTLKQKADPAPYFVSYTVTESDRAVVASTLGSITLSNKGRSRQLDVSVRVGDPRLDNYHRVRGDRPRFTAGTFTTIDDVPAAIRRTAWLETDRVYRAAVERLMQIRTTTQVKVAEKDDSGDFSPAQPVTHSTAPAKLVFPLDKWAERLRKLSGRFSSYPEVLTSSVTVTAVVETKYLVNTEGTRLVHGRGFARIMISGAARAADGTDVSADETMEAVSPADLPSDDAIRKAIDKVGRDVAALVRAPEAEPAIAPAILSGRASGVFFHEIFGHRVEGHRQKDDSEGQTFTASVGASVLPPFLSVTFDPTRRKSGSIDLNGWYEYDDEGVPAQQVRAVENGILKTFLLSRSPIKGFDRSNGHGRRQAGLEPLSRQSNLLVESTRQVPEKQLRQMLIDEIKRQKKPYGFYFEQVTGGFTTTGRAGIQAFKVIPLVVYRVYPDGRPDELVRGADIVGTPLASFAKILSTSDNSTVFNGYCGAESGQVPVSAVSPALLISEIEIERKQKSQERPPLLPPPTVSGGAGPGGAQ
jgi:TldD protein